ncbi:Galactoside 2-alpha-L-fucosyltransferase 2, partial [Lamellibrachia satsuma]
NMRHIVGLDCSPDLTHFNIQTMLLTVVGKRVFVVLLLVAIATFCVFLYLSNRGLFYANLSTALSAGDSSSNIRTKNGVNVIYDNEESLPLPVAQHPVVTMSRLRYLSEIERRIDGTSFASLKSHGDLDCHNRTIVLRYRSNTSTMLEPRPDAGRLVATYMGRTGNRMYIFAGLYGIARRNGMHPVISANNPLLNLFQLNVTVVQDDRPGRDWVQYIPFRGTYDRHTEYLDPRVDTELVGYVTNWQYFEHVMRDLVQNHFRFREAIQHEADNFLRHSMAQFGFSPSDVAVIAVHIRRTDLVRRRIKAGSWNSIPDRAYFSHAVAFFNRLFKNKTMYVVCSDDVKWSKVNFVTESPTVFSVGHSADVDFAILSRCNHSILTIGTFGQWSAYMAGGITVYHKAGSPTYVPLDAAFRKVNPTQNPRIAWIALS